MANHTNYDPETSPDLARKFCMLGATNADLGRMFDASERAVENWIARYPSFRRAVYEGRAIADAEVASKLYKRAVGYKQRTVKIFQYQGEPVIVPHREVVAPDVTAQMFWLKNRRPDLWREKVHQEHTGKDGEELDVGFGKLAEALDSIARTKAGSAGPTPRVDKKRKTGSTDS